MSVRQKQKGPKKKREEDRGPRLSRQEAKIRQKVNPSLRKDLDSLRRYEKRILTGLKDDETARLFLSDPGAALAKIGVAVPPAIRKRLKPDELGKSLFCPFLSRERPQTQRRSAVPMSR